MPWIGERPPGDLPELSEQPEQQERKPEVSNDLVESYSVFREAIKPLIDLVYYPSCATDVSPSTAFKEARVIYVDIDEKAVVALRKAGYEAHNQSALEFKPDKPVDVLILFNPQIPPDVPSQYVKNDGYALCNDYHRTVTALRKNEQFKLVGIIRRDKKSGQKFLDTESPEDYWKTIETDDEFKSAPFSWGDVSYQVATAVVKKVTGKDYNVLNEYKKIIELAKKAQLKEDDPLTYEFEGGRIYLDSSLPRKKGVTDDLFVFQRITEPEADDAYKAGSSPKPGLIA